MAKDKTPLRDEDLYDLIISVIDGACASIDRGCAVIDKACAEIGRAIYGER